MTTTADTRHDIKTGPSEAGQRLDRVLAARLPDLSRSRLKSLIEQGKVLCGEATILEPAYRVKRGQTFAIFVPQPTPATLEPQALPLDIVYEDAHLIVLNKPAGLVVHPAPGNADRTLVNALLAHCGDELAGIGGVRRPGIVHRLDKGTSGLMVAAKTESAYRGLVADFAARRVQRTYTAVVWGVPEPREGEIVGNIGRSPRNRKKMAVLSRGGRPARTHYNVVKALAGGLASVVDCRLATGRTHQIRVHMAARGHPILGDPLYGRASGSRMARLTAGARTALDALGRQALHARSLGFVHPGTGETLKFETKLPRDIKILIDSLEML